MNLEEFRIRAHEIYDSIPARYREGVDSLEIELRAASHPSLEEVFTLGECLSEFYPSDFGGPGEVRSRIVLYYGSFLELAREDPEWDWEEELFETITHEIRHHREHLASEAELELLDHAMDQNFSRREGLPFDPDFYRAGTEIAPDLFEVGEDRFREVKLDRGAMRAGSITIDWEGVHRVRIPSSLADVHLLHLPAPEGRGGDRVLVLVRPWTLRRWIDLFRGRSRRQVAEEDAELIRPE